MALAEEPELEEPEIEELEAQPLKVQQSISLCEWLKWMMQE